MKALRFAILSALLLSAFSCGEVFADSVKDVPAKEKVTAPAETPKDASSTKNEVIVLSGSLDSETGSSDPAEKEREKQKAIDDVNAFLIESYKIKLDKLLDDVYRSVRVAAKDDPALQTLLLKRVLVEIEAKMDSIAARTISPNRKKILLAVFSYLKSDVESKIRSLGEK
ncbi:MAG: hypothetical protein QMC36_03900 [Patescibacteria group bacterium]